MNKMISVSPGFQYSVNIGFDLNNDEKLKNFIPTRSSLMLLEDILSSTQPLSTDRARVLVGAYGKGKSHIVLMIMSLLMKKDISLFEKLRPRLEENPKLLQLVENYYDSNNKMLPVVVTGSNTSLTQAFILALQRTLSDNNLLDVMPETNYKAAVSVVARWKTEFPNTYLQFNKMIDEPVEQYLDRLSNYDVSAYELFERCYRELTSGSTFNPFLGFDVVELYENAAKGLLSKGYSGIYLIYDEFSKYLEANIKDASVSDTKMLQDFAEKCNRSGSLQMHLMLICHKEISNYIDKLPQQKVDGWRGVSERFKHIHINNNFSQTYEIISNVIQKDPSRWCSFLSNKSSDFVNLRQRYEKHTMFLGESDHIDRVIEGCYPLHPVSTFVLPRLSEKVAQNERTLFTFLSSAGSFTLPSYLEEFETDKEFGLITPDLIYDYFEPLLKKEAYGGSIHNLYLLTRNILNKLQDGTLESKLIKTIALIYILEQFEKLKPTMEELVGVYSTAYTVDEIESAITGLIEKEYVIYLKRSNSFLRLKESSGVNIRQHIQDVVAQQAGVVSVKDILNEINFDHYMYPARYNDEREMIRYFSFEFINSSEIYDNVNWDIKSESVNADGVIYGVIPSSEEELQNIINLIETTSRGFDRCLFIVPKHYNEIENTVREYHAAASLKEKAGDDQILFDEYEVVCEDLLSIVQNYIGGYTQPDKYESIYFHNGERRKIRRKAELTELMSSICDEIYNLTPVINNESVNRTEITNVAIASRNKIIGGLLRSELEPNLGLSGTGQDVSIMRSTLIRTGLLNEIGGVTTINIHPEDMCMRNMLSTIEQFIIDARQNGKECFDSLYQKLIKPEYHIGLRWGLIPIYIAAVFHEYRQQVVIADKHGQLPISTEVLMQVNADPSLFYLEYLDWNPEKEEYVDTLSKAFETNIVDAERLGNSYDFVVNAMKRWYMSLPKYSKESKNHPDGKKINKRQIEMIRLLKSGDTGSELLFKKLPAAFDYREEFTSDAADDVIATKLLFDGLLNELKTKLIADTKEMFSSSKLGNSIERMSLSSVIRDWCDARDSSVFEQLFADGTDRFLSLAKDITNDEDLFITKLAKCTTNLRIEDWDGKTQNLFVKTLEQYKHTAESFHANENSNEESITSSYQITFADGEGNNTTKRFDRVDITPRGKLLSNQVNAALESMGHAISEQEKRQVLIEILKELC